MPKLFTTARVREVSTGTQFFLFILIGQFLKFFTLRDAPVTEQPALVAGGAALVMLSPFIWARIPPLMAITPGLFLRREARVELHAGGLIYHFDSVKRPLFVEWNDLQAIERHGLGLSFTVRPGADVTRGMPSYQGQFWRKKIARPVTLRYIDRFSSEDALAECLDFAAASGVDVSGFGPNPALSPA